MSKAKLPKILQDLMDQISGDNTPSIMEVMAALEERVSKMDPAEKQMYEELCSEVTEILGRKGYSTRASSAEDRVKEAAAANMPKCPLPAVLHKELSRFVKGQDHAKKVVAVGVYQHYQRRLNGIGGKSNILLTGPTGCGKTEIARTLGKILDVVVTVADSTNLTAHGYVGKDVDSVLLTHLANCGHDREKAENGIIFIDEIDKKSVKKSTTGGPDVGGESVQQALLKILEGTVVELEQGQPGMPKKTYQLDTSNILFIVGGAFVDLEKKIAARLNRHNTGFGAAALASGQKQVIASPDLLPQIMPEDFQNFGLIPEFIGRLPVLAALHPLTEKHMLEIMKEADPSVNILNEFESIFKSFGVELTWEEKALTHVAEYVVNEAKIGARGLRNAISHTLVEKGFELPGSDTKKFKVTKKFIEQRLPLTYKLNVKK